MCISYLVGLIHFFHIGMMSPLFSLSDYLKPIYITPLLHSACSLTPENTIKLPDFWVEAFSDLLELNQTYFCQSVPNTRDLVFLKVISWLFKRTVFLVWMCPSVKLWLTPCSALQNDPEFISCHKLKYSRRQLKFSNTSKANLLLSHLATTAVAWSIKADISQLSQSRLRCTVFSTEEASTLQITYMLTFQGLYLCIRRFCWKISKVWRVG